MVRAGVDLSVLLALLDPDDPFEFDVDNMAHLLADVGLGPDDALDVFYDSPRIFEDDSDGSAAWLMVGEVPGGDVLVIPLAQSKYSGNRKLRPITVLCAPAALVDRYYAEEDE